MLNTNFNQRILFGLMFSTLIVSACSDSDDDDSSVPGSDTDTASGSSTDPAPDTSVNIANFVDDALASSNIIDCTLSDGTETQCYELVTAGTEKTADQIGPFCPTNLSTNADDSGVWLDGTMLYEADGDFFLDLPNLYGDQFPPADNWIFYDDNGDISITDTLEGCQAAAQPNVEEEFQSFCVQCSLDDLGTEITSLTFTIPVTPQVADETGTLSADAGISLNGFQIAAQAPVQDILSNWTIAAFDDCGGHVNPNDGYHYHSATGRDGCNSAGSDADGHPSLIGYAMDGYGIYGTLDNTSDEANSLDECNGVEDAILGYHYHASSPELNQHIGCFRGKTVESAEQGPGGPGGPGGPPDGPPQ